ncbi:MAG: MFS transporter [Planctomycetes bacterium]|nr:MFS transporter [Planctomycetota bacterium]
MMPLIARPALAQLLGVDPNTDTGHTLILRWTGYIMWGSAICGGTFGLLGGYLTDRFGRRRVLVWSILIYAFSALAAGFSTSPAMLLVLRCTTFVGVCVEFVAAVAWLAELFPEPRRREAVLGYTQAFSSVGGLMVTAAYLLAVELAPYLPAIHGEHVAWRYTLISGVIPALPLILIRPFLPESPAWQSKRTSGTLKRPSFAQLFRPAFRRTTFVTAALFACGYGAAFGAIQLTPQIVPGLVPELPQLVKLRRQYETTKAKTGNPEDADVRSLKERVEELQDRQETVVGGVQIYQEMGGLLGRFALAWLAIRIASRRTLLRLFQVPGLILIPLVYLFPAAGNLPSLNLELLRAGVFLAGFLTVAQFSFWGNYLPRVYPTYLRGTGESFAANVGGRMVGTAANPVSTIILAPWLLASIGGLARPASIAYAAAAVAFLVYAIGSVLTFWLPEPGKQAVED